MKKFINEATHQCTIEKVELTCDGTRLPVLQILPKEIDQLHTVFLCFHGMESKKEEWVELDDYTKGGNLIADLLAEGYGFVAFDAWHHGAHVPEGTTVDYESIMDDDDKWEAFKLKTIDFSHAAIKHMTSKDLFVGKRLGVMSYSMGSAFATYAINNTPEMTIAVNMVPETFRGYDDGDASYNNMDRVKDHPFLFVLASKDEYVSYEDYQWYVDKVPLNQKSDITIESGHSLTIDYVPQVVNWLKKQ